VHDIDHAASRSLMWNAGAVAGLVGELIAANVTVDELQAPTAALRERLLDATVIAGNRAFDALSADWQREH
jgi:hypothetical protein